MAEETWIERFCKACKAVSIIEWILIIIITVLIVCVAVLFSYVIGNV
jgi:hypothetical protein